MTAGLILAAGAGTRFGEEPKLLADLNGKPVLQHVVDAANAALSPVVVVLGANADAIRARLDFGAARVLVNEAWAEGQSTSLRCGVRELHGQGEVSKLVVLLGDQPVMSTSLIAQFSALPGGTRAAHAGRPGHPAVFERREIEAALRATGDEGLKHLEWQLVEVDESLRDIDTREDLEAIRREARAVL